MHTCRSFLAFAAVAQLIGPTAGGVISPAAAKRLVTERLPAVRLQAHAGRDVHFINDRSTGQLAILDLRFDAQRAVDGEAAPIVRGARQLGGCRQAHDFYMYSLTRQSAIRDEAELRRYMAWYAGDAGAGQPAPGASDVELLRLRFGVLTGAG